MLTSVLLAAAGILVVDDQRLRRPASCGSVDPSNHAPEWDTATPKEASGDESSAIHFTVRATDADNDPLTYSLSGLPTGAKAEPAEGAVQVSWSPTASDVGVYPVKATVTDGKTTVTREIKVIVREEHESYFMPGAGYSIWVPADDATYGVFDGFSIELLVVRLVHQSEKHGPSHGRIYTDLDVLFSTHSGVGGTAPGGTPQTTTIDPAFLALTGFDLSLEKDPGRRWFIPFFGLEGGVLFQKQTTTLGVITPFAGMHIFSTRNVEISLKAGYMLPFTSEQFDQLAGFRARLAADFSLW